MISLFFPDYRSLARAKQPWGALAAGGQSQRFDNQNDEENGVERDYRHNHHSIVEIVKSATVLKNLRKFYQ